MGDGKDLELARPAGLPKLELASSIDEAKTGQLVMVDSDGNAVARRRLIGRAYAAVALRASLLVAMMSELLFVHQPLAAMGALAGFSIQAVVRAGRNRVFRAALALVAARRYDEAFVAFEELERRRLPLGQRALVKAKLAVLDWIRGHRDGALPRYDQVLDMTRGRRRLRAVYWHAALERATLLAALGRLDEARRVLADLDGAPTGELFTMLRRDLALIVAFHADDASDLPDDLVLHDWARAALGRTRFGISLVRLSWAFARRGDIGMAQHLLTESSSRLDYPLANIDPAMGAWMADRLVEWGIPIDADA
jgi:hypothetical protein